MSSHSGIAATQAAAPSLAEEQVALRSREELRPILLRQPVYWWSLALSFLLVLLIGLYSLGVDRILSGKNDFAPVYAATQMVGTPYMYDKQKIYDVIIDQFGGTSASWRYTRMPFHAAALWPLSRLSYRSAYAVYLVLQIAAVAAFVALWRIPSRSYTLLFAMLSFPLFFSLLTGQDTVFLLLWIALAVRYESRGKAFWAGLFLSLCAIKFHLFLFLPLLLVGQRRWRMTAGLVAGGSVLLAISFLAAGLRWPLDYYETLSDPIINPAAYLMVNLHGLFLGLPSALAWDVASALLIAVVVWFAVRQASFLEGLAVSLVAGLLASYHTYTGDCVLLIPAASIVLTRMHSPWAAWPAAIALTPILFMVLLGADWAYGVQFMIVGLFCASAAYLMGQKRAPAARPARVAVEAFERRAGARSGA